MRLERELEEKLVQAALEARENAYAPYSHYLVGAALLGAGGEIVTGCNVENSSYGATCCAERTAVFRAVSQGERSFLGLAVAGGLEGCAPQDYAFPCGVCRQVLSEFCGPDFPVIVAKSVSDYQVFSLGELLPDSFGGESIR